MRAAALRGSPSPYQQRTARTPTKLKPRTHSKRLAASRVKNQRDRSSRTSRLSLLNQNKRPGRPISGLTPKVASTSRALHPPPRRCVLCPLQAQKKKEAPFVSMAQNCRKTEAAARNAATKQNLGAEQEEGGRMAVLETTAPDTKAEGGNSVPKSALALHRGNGLVNGQHPPAPSDPFPAM